MLRAKNYRRGARDCPGRLARDRAEAHGRRMIRARFQTGGGSADAAAAAVGSGGKIAFNASASNG